MLQHVSTLLSTLLPQQCLLCRNSHNHSAALCDSCRQYLPWNKHACRCCAIPLPGPAELCGQCLQQRPVFTSTIAPLLYAHPVDYLIKQIKFHNKLAAARGLGMLLAEAVLQESQPLADVIIPVPLHHSRLRQRGFNQAQEIARPLSSMLGIKIDSACCERIRPTTAQSDLPLAQRHANIRGAFRVRSAISAKHVAIVDDVMTSGQTVSALGHELLKQGVEQVSIWCIARTAH